MNPARSPAGTLAAFLTTFNHQTHRHSSTSAPQPPGRGRASKPTRLPACWGSGERESPAQPSQPAWCPSTEQPHTPEDRQPQQDTRTACVAPRTCVGHPDLSTGCSCPAGCRGRGVPRHEPRCHAPLGWAGPARACRAAGNWSGRRWWLCHASRELAAPGTRSSGGRGAQTHLPGEAQPSLGTAGARAPTPGALSPNRGTPCPGGIPGVSTPSAEMARPCPRLGGVPVLLQAGRGQPRPCPRAGRGHTGTQHRGREVCGGGLGRGTGSCNRNKGAKGWSGSAVTAAGRSRGTQ